MDKPCFVTAVKGRGGGPHKEQTCFETVSFGNGV